MFRRWSLRTLLIVVAVIAVGLAIGSRWTYVNFEVSLWLSADRVVPQDFFEQSPESLHQFESELVAWYQRNGYERVEPANVPTYYCFQPIDSKARDRKITIVLGSPHSKQPLTIELRVPVRWRTWGKVPGVSPTTVERNLTAEFVGWLDERIGPLPHHTY